MSWKVNRNPRVPKRTSCTGVPCERSGGVSPVILPISAASSLTCPSCPWFGPAGVGFFSSAYPLRDTIAAIRGCCGTIDGLDRIASDLLARIKFTRGGMAKDDELSYSSWRLKGQWLPLPSTF